MRILSILAIAATTLFAACGGGSESPSEVATKFLTHIDKKEFKEAKAYGTKATGELLDMIASMASMMPAEETPGFTIKSENIDGDKATVTYRSNGKDEDETLSLVKENGKWLVSMSKEDLNKEEGAGDMDMDFDADTLNLEGFEEVMEDEAAQ
jgi:ABC-type glycerol-3-phosphate transport system substrate-binding protein